MDEGKDQLDVLLGEFFAAELNPQLGKAQARFAAEVGRPAGSARRRWVILSAVTAIAACVVIALKLVNGGHNPGRHVPTDNGSTGGIATSADGAQWVPVSRQLSYRSYDEGTVVLVGDVPARRVRRQYVEQVKWYDPAKDSYIQQTTPGEEVVFVAVHRY